MKDNWNELFDNMKEDDRLRTMPDFLPELEDELAAKRIETRVFAEMKKEKRKQTKKWALAAAICCLAILGTFGRQSILAAFQRLFHDLPGIGIYINDENKKIYEVQTDEPVREKDGVQVELKNFYCEGLVIYGEIVITGDIQIDFDDPDRNEKLDEKFALTWFDGEKERDLISFSRSILGDDNGKIVRYMPRCEEWLRLEDGFDTYRISVKGFDKPFTLKIVEPKTTEDADALGYSVTKNETTVTARAAVTEKGIELEYFLIPSAEAKRAAEVNRRHYMGRMPYQFDMDERWYAADKNGEQLERIEGEYLANGVKTLYHGTEKDFPLRLYYPPMTGSNSEEHTLELQLPADGETVTNGLPEVEFEYGTVKFLSLERDKNDARFLYRVTPGSGSRQMYQVRLETDNWSGAGGMETGTDDLYVQGLEVTLKTPEAEKVNVTLKDPFYWIEGSYEVIIEKPMEK